MSKGLYIHVPFCRRKCLYCDFYSVTDFSLSDSYVNAVIRNIKARGERYDTVYFGGGTPSLLSGRQVYAILSAADIESGAEISAECNPDSADINKLSELHSAGINRISLGIQSLDDKELKMLGRLHDSAQAVLAVKNARASGFDNISADLMLGLPFQNIETVKSNISRLAEHEINHISAYMLKVEENTPLAEKTELVSNIADDELSADIYLSAVELLEEKGFYQYEISNFSHRGYECRHNLKYWKCEDYFGTGPSAHSCIDGKRFAVPKDICGYIHSERQQEIITDENACGDEERLMLSLRLAEGCPIPENGGESVIKAAKELQRHGLLNIADNRIMLTPKGFLVSNSIICLLSEAMEA